jgi:hypothetical protein
MGYTAGQFTGHKGLAAACVGGAEVPRHDPPLHNAHRGEQPALEHARAIAGNLSLLLVDATPIAFSMAARAADIAPAATTEHSLALRVRTLVRQELERLDGVAQHMGARVVFCWDGPSVADLKRDRTSERMRQRKLNSRQWHAEASRSRPREHVLARHAGEAAMHALGELYAPQGIDALLNSLGQQRVSSAAALTSGRCVHVVADDEADCLIAQLAVRHGHGESTAVLSNDSDMLVHACDEDSYRWVVRPAPVTVKPAENYGLAAPLFHHQHLFDRTLLGTVLKRRFSAMFPPAFDPVAYLVFVATGKTDYGNGFHGVGAMGLAKDGRIRRACSQAVGATVALRATDAVRRLGAAVGASAKNVVKVQCIVAVYATGRHTACTARSTVMAEAESRARSFGYRKGAAFVDCRVGVSKVHQPVVPVLRTVRQGHVVGEELDFKRQVSRSVLSHAVEVLVPRSQIDAPHTHLTPDKPAPLPVWDEDKNIGKRIRKASKAAKHSSSKTQRRASKRNASPTSELTFDEHVFDKWDSSDESYVGEGSEGGYGSEAEKEGSSDASSDEWDEGLSSESDGESDEEADQAPGAKGRSRAASKPQAQGRAKTSTTAKRYMVKVSACART